MKINQNGQSDEWCGTHITDLDYELRPFFEALKKKNPSLPPVDEMLVDPDLISHFTSKKKKALIWEVYDVDVYANDDYHKMPAGTPINVVKEVCIKLGSRCFVTKDNCQYYIRSPPGGRKKGRDYSSIKKKVAESKKAVAKGVHRPNGYKSYVCNY